MIVIADWIWCLTVAACFNTNGTTIGESLAKIVSFSFAIIELEILLILNIVSFLRLAMAKQGVVDPEMPWGENDGLAIRRIRGASMVCVTIIVSVMYLCGGYPHAFYYLIGDERSILHLPNATLIFTITLMSLFAIPVITSIMIGVCFRTENHSTMDKLRGWINQFLFLVTTPIGIALVYGVARNHLEAGQYLIVGQCLSFWAGAFVLILIITKLPLRNYVKNTLTNSASRLGINRSVIIRIPNIFPRRSRQIHAVVI